MNLSPSIEMLPESVVAQTCVRHDVSNWVNTLSNDEVRRELYKLRSVAKAERNTKTAILKNNPISRLDGFDYSSLTPPRKRLVMPHQGASTHMAAHTSPNVTNSKFQAPDDPRASFIDSVKASPAYRKAYEKAFNGEPVSTFRKNIRGLPEGPDDTKFSRTVLSPPASHCKSAEEDHELNQARKECSRLTELLQNSLKLQEDILASLRRKDKDIELLKKEKASLEDMLASKDRQICKLEEACKAKEVLVASAKRKDREIEALKDGHSADRSLLQYFLQSADKNFQ